MDDDRISRSDSTVATVSVLRVTGEVDAGAADDLRSQLAEATAGSSGVLVVDLSEVTYMSCSGLRPLLQAHARLGDRLWLRDLSRPVRKLLGLTGTRATFGVLDGSADHARLTSARSSFRAASQHRHRLRTRRVGSTPVPTTPAPRFPRGDGTDVVQTTAAFELQAQVTGLQEEIRRGVVIEQAKGLLMGIHRCDASTSWQLLTEAAHEHDWGVVDLACALVATTEARRGDHASGGVASAAVQALLAPAPDRA